MSNVNLLLWLEGPFQSWGDDSRYGRRDSLKFPSKSALCGMICASMGAKGEQTELLKYLNESKVTVLSYSKQKRKYSFLRDFHTVGNGYNSKDSFESLLIPKTSEGKAPNGSGSKITYRYYLQEVCHAVIWELPPMLANKVADSLVDPVYFLSLGRKNSVPSEWIYQGIFKTFDEALSNAQLIAKNKHRNCFQKIIEGNYPEQGEVVTLHDIALQFGQLKKYSDRLVTIIDQEI